MDLTSMQTDPNDIFFFRPDLPVVETARIFEIRQVDGNLSVKNKNINYLFKRFTPDQFDLLYNDFNRHLNLDFDPVIISGSTYFLKAGEEEYLIQKIITSWIYFYTINELPVEVKRSDFIHPYMVDYVLSILDKKYGIDTPEALSLGARILRQDLDEYKSTVQGRRRYYDR